MHREKKEKHFLKKAFYPGGLQAMRAFIKAQLRYPKEALEKGIEGDVQLTLSINRKGQVTRVHIRKSLGHGCDEEAIRVAKLLQFTVPPPPGHLKTRLQFQKKLAIHFRLPKEKTPKQIPNPSRPDEWQQSIRYQYTSSTTQAQKTSYFYHLSLPTEEE